MQLAAFLDGFVAALQPGGVGAAPAWMDALAAQPGFAVYRNSGCKAAVDALRANYPTIEQLVGKDWFHGAAQRYLAQQPPADGLLMRYGAGFPAFLDNFAPAAELPWLGDVARLDRAWTEAHLAPDAPPLAANWMTIQAPEALGAALLPPHPAARWLWSDAHPAYSIWQRHREGLAMDEALPWEPQGALITRPEDGVQWCPLPRAGVAFLDACAAHKTLTQAAQAAVECGAEAPADIATLIALLLGAGALAEPEPKETP
ncbi:MAG: DNA-binding domain-containing protein [Burkholderiaceae bacterium]|jgi:hypothetical protein|nr:putative DNA-binding domain-containing protein [Burkholderiaceae bacterium]MCO5103437.1 DNA-binding domain-containing protein [Burkholderiaceae bacterium]